MAYLRWGRAECKIWPVSVSSSATVPSIQPASSCRGRSTLRHHGRHCHNETYSNDLGLALCPLGRITTRQFQQYRIHRNPASSQKGQRAVFAKRLHKNKVNKSWSHIGQIHIQRWMGVKYFLIVKEHYRCNILEASWRVCHGQ